MTLLLDASAVLAAILDEPGGDAAHDAMDDGAISIVNLCEVWSRLTGSGMPLGHAQEQVARLELPVLAFEAAHALEAARLRPLTARHGLSLGDRVCLGVATARGLPVVTADRQWTKLDLGLDIRLIR